MKCIHLDIQADRHTDAKTGLILRVKIFNHEMTEYEKIELLIELRTF